MGWRDLLEQPGAERVSAWVGGRSLRCGAQQWSIEGRLPIEHGWYRFGLQGRRAKLHGPAEPDADALTQLTRGYLVGDHLVSDDARVDPEPSRIADFAEPVHLLDRGLDRFVRIVAGRAFEGGPLIYKHQDMPLGAEDAVMAAYLERQPSVTSVAHVPPALDAAFRMETWVRAETERRRAELAELQRREAERLEREEQLAKLRSQTGSSMGRRALAQVDFGQAAKAALGLVGAEYLDHKRGYFPNEMVVTYRFLNRVLVCTCDATTLRIIDAGVCLTDHATGIKSDTWFSLESLPTVIAEAHRKRKLVVQLRPTDYIPGRREDFDHDDFADEEDD
jgi:hypothetical protein